MLSNAPPVAIVLNVWKISGTFGSEPAGRVLLSSVHSPLKWYKDAKDEDKTSHCQISLQ